MKPLRIIPSSVLISAFIILSSCNSICVEGLGDTVTRQVDVNVMKGIVQNSSIPVEISYGMNQKVEVTGKENLIALLETKVKDELWRIDVSEHICSEGMKISITLPLLERIFIAGSGDVTGITPFQGDDMEFRIIGSGSLRIEISAKDVEIEIDGSGDVMISGRCEELDMDSNGSGDIQASKLKAKDVTASSDGSGDIELSASGALDASVSGSGDIYYEGEPAEIKTIKKGSGEVLKK